MRVLNMDDMQVVCGEKRHDATSWAVPPCDRLRAGAFVVREEGGAPSLGASLSGGIVI